MEGGAGRLDGTALSDRHGVLTVDVRLRDRPFRYAAPEDFDEVVDEAGEDAVDVCLHDGAGLIASFARCRHLLTDNPQTPLPRPR
ncbi:hypothetical protein GCM10010415_65670 [Streptomyces atrovirens]